MSTLSEVLKVRLDSETDRLLREQAADKDRPPGYLAREYIKAGVTAEAKRRRNVRRV